MNKTKVNSIGVFVVNKYSDGSRRSIKIKLQDNSFIEDGLVITPFEGGLVITKPSLDDEDYMELRVNKDGWHCTTMKTDLPLGRFNFSEQESTEDEKVVCFHDLCYKSGDQCLFSCKGLCKNS